MADKIGENGQFFRWWLIKCFQQINELRSESAF